MQSSPSNFAILFDYPGEYTVRVNFVKVGLSALVAGTYGVALAVFPSSIPKPTIYDGVGMCGVTGDLSSYVAIAPHWMLTSRHSDTTFVVFNDVPFTILERVNHPTADIALVRCEETFTTFHTPFYGNVNGQEVDIVGVGMSGTETATGYNVNQALGTRRQARNTVDFFGSATLDNVDFFDSYLFDLDAPTGNGSLGGSRIAREGGVASGDSGGGWFVSIDNQPRTVGITSFILDADGNGNSFNFGDQAGAVALTSYESWIEGHINPVPEPGTIFAVTLGAGCLLRRRVVRK